MPYPSCSCSPLNSAQFCFRPGQWCEWRNGELQNCTKVEFILLPSHQLHKVNADTTRNSVLFLRQDETLNFSFLPSLDCRIFSGGQFTHVPGINCGDNALVSSLTATGSILFTPLASWRESWSGVQNKVAKERQNISTLQFLVHTNYLHWNLNSRLFYSNFIHSVTFWPPNSWVK